MVFKRKGGKREVAPGRDTIQGINVSGEAGTLRKMCQWSTGRGESEEAVALTQQRENFWRLGRRICRRLQRCAHREPCHLTTQNKYMNRFHDRVSPLQAEKEAYGPENRKSESYLEKLGRQVGEEPHPTLRIEGRHTPLY